MNENNPAETEEIVIKVITPEDSAYRQELELRDKTLWQPSASIYYELRDETQDYHIVAVKFGEVVGCLVLTRINETALEMREVAVEQFMQRRGIGKMLIDFSETFAKSKGYERIQLSARMTAVPFYEKNNYETVGSQYMEFGSPHSKMQKSLVSILVEIRECTSDDIGLLTKMNKQLIEDEKADNPMDITQLQYRMSEFLSSGYKAFLFSVAGNTVGYALCDMTKEPKYLRQFFIAREERRKNYGKTAFYKLLEKLEINKIEIDVLKWNETGTKFWEKLGFEEQWKRMKFQK